MPEKAFLSQAPVAMTVMAAKWHHSMRRQLDANNHMHPTNQKNVVSRTICFYGFLFLSVVSYL
jgi:hypothetical protein